MIGKYLNESHPFKKGAKAMSPLPFHPKSLFFFFLLFSWAPPSFANNLDFSPADVVQWVPIEGKAYDDGTVVGTVFLETKENFGLYENKLKVYNTETHSFLSFTPPLSESSLDPVSGKNVNVFRGGNFEFIFTSFAPHEKSHFTFLLEFTGCSSKICLFPYKHKISIPVYRVAGSYTPKKNSLQQEKLTQKIAQVSPHEPKKSLFEFDQTSFAEKAHQTGSLKSFLLFLLFLFFAGIATNFTPCVYPMIPITIRILSKQKTSPLLASSFYGLGIMLTYSTLALVAIATGSMFGKLLANDYVNLLLAFIMFYFGISMLGYGQYGFLQKLGNKFSPKGSGVKAAFVMGLGAGLIASPCTGPVLGSLLTYSATKSEPPVNIFLYFLTYSFGFSLPYVLLGKAASSLVKLEFKSSLQQITKSLFAGIMFGLFFYYLRIPFYKFYQVLSSYWNELAILSFLGFLFLAILPKRKEWALFKVLPVIILGFFFFSLTGVLKNSKGAEIPWMKDEKAALQKAETEKRPVLIDMWAEWCEVCKKMDQSTFKSPKLKAFLEQEAWVLLKLDLTKETEKNQKTYEKYQLKGLPTLVILPDGQLENKVLLSGTRTTDELLQELKKYSKGS